MSSWSGAYTVNQMFSYYPKYEYLDSLVTSTGLKKINLFIDFKSCAQALFQEWAIKYIISQSQGASMVDTSLFAAVLEFIAFHKNYAKKRNIDLKFYFFMESGKSSYHLQIYKGYKAGRGIGDFFGLDLASKELFFNVIDKNYHVIDKVANKIPNTTFIRLMFLEADFIPWYLMKNVIPKNDVESSINVIYSTDKDMHQCLTDSNIFQFCRSSKKGSSMVTEKDIYKNWLKIDYNIENGSHWFPLALSVVGDSGDGVPGVGGVGAKTFHKIFQYVMTLCGHNIENVYTAIKEKRQIFDHRYVPSNTSLKKILDSEDIIIRNLKLTSFRLISDYLEGGFPLDAIEKKKIIFENVNSSYKASNPSILYNALEKAGLTGTLKETTISSLF